MSVLSIFLAAGAFAGLMAGLLGIGGGIIIVPILAAVFPHLNIAPELTMHMAVATSLASIMFTSLASVYAHEKKNAVSWPVFQRMALGLVVGGWCGSFLADLASTHTLRFLFGILELLVAVQLVFDFKPRPQRRIPGTIGLLMAGVGIGVLSALVGIGGGTMVVPFLVWCAVGVRNAVATSSACGFPIAAAGSFGFIIAGWNSHSLPEWSLGYVYFPALLGISVTSVIFAPLGAQLAHKVPGRWLKRLFALFLATVGIVMMLG